MFQEPGILQIKCKNQVVLQVITADANSALTGTALFQVTKRHPVDNDGMFVDVKFCGASNPACTGQSQGYFNAADGRKDGSASLGILHLCGHDHIELEDEKIMLNQQRLIMDILEKHLDSHNGIPSLIELQKVKGTSR